MKPVDPTRTLAVVIVGLGLLVGALTVALIAVLRG